MFGWLRSRKRKRVSAAPLPEGWLEILERRAPFFTRLKGSRREEFLGKLKIFVFEKHFIGGGGFAITDEVKVTIAAHAVRLVLALDISLYDRLTEIVVHPDDYVRPDDDAVYGGEAHHWGVVVLSWKAVCEQYEEDGVNTTLHEFAHVLDRFDGGFDGTPLLASRNDYERWSKVMSRHFEKLRRGDRAHRAVLDEYGAEDEAEFFAVCSETFFEVPEVLKEAFPDLYAELKRFYRQDPAKDLGANHQR